MPAPLILRIIGDATSYFRTVEQTIGVNAKLGGSYTTLGVKANTSADAQIRAAIKAQEALKVNAGALSQRAATLPTGSREQVAATLLAAEAQGKYARSLGITTSGTHALSGASRTAERDLNKTVRGALAGSGVFSKLGRSLAFASSGFIAVAVGAQLISRSITRAEALAKAQESLSAAIKHTGGNLAVLRPQYLATAKAAAQYGVSEADALGALARATVLTGNATAARRAYVEALLISKATGKDFNAVLVATAKGQEGETASLRRYGILVASTATGQEQFTQVMKRFGGQAAANTTASDRLHASVANFEAALGTALLPTFDRLAGKLAAWLSGMEKSGKLQKDVNGIVSTASHVFSVLGGIIGFVDKLTGSFANTLQIIIGMKVVSVLAGWVGSIGRLATAWDGVTASATEAAGAEKIASTGTVAGAPRTTTSSGSSAASKAVKGFIAVALVDLAGQQIASVAHRFSNWLGGTSFGRAVGAGDTPGIGNVEKFVQAIKDAKAGTLSAEEKAYFAGLEQSQQATTRAFAGEMLRIADIQNRIFTSVSQENPLGIPLGVAPLLRNPFLNRPAPATGPVPYAPISQWAGYQLSATEQIAQAQASLTKSTGDDVAVAKRIVARVKRVIASGHLSGKALAQALQTEAGALSTIWSAEDAAAQKRAAAAQAAAQRIAAQIQDSIDPLRLEVALSRAQALGEPLKPILRQLRAAAEKALKSGKLSLQQQKEAWDQITSLNQQLSTTTTSALSLFKQAKTRALTAGLGLTEAQRAALRARLSQLGPGGTVAGKGTGAYGYEIGAHGHAIHVHAHTTIKLDGKKVAANTTRHQERRNRRNSSQRRGPNAG